MKNCLKKSIFSPLLAIGTLLCLSAFPSLAAPIKLANSASGCTRYSGFSFSPQGAVTLKGCSKASRQATFTITPAATTVKKGSPLKITISRTIGSGGKAGKEVLTLKSTGVAGTFSPATVTFNTGTTRKTVTVKFSADGTATLSATGATTVIPSNPIVVTNPTTSGCNTIPSVNRGSMPIGSGVKYDITGPMALRFNISSADAKDTLYSIIYEDSVPSTLHVTMDTVISTCAGDFTAIGMLIPSNCISNKVSSYGVAMSVKSDRACHVEPNIDYFIQSAENPVL